jgi:penicillin-binding protein 1C
MWDVSGTSGAAPVWATLMNYLHHRQPSRAPKPPAGVVQAPVQFATAAPGPKAAPIEAARAEWFVQGTQQARFAVNSKAADAKRSARITAPASGTIIALDPDIPPKRQRVSFLAEGSNLRWRLDGKPFATGPTAQWLPWPGHHLVQLVGPRGEVLDEIRLEVRGAGVKVGQASTSGQR